MQGDLLDRLGPAKAPEGSVEVLGWVERSPAGAELVVTLVPKGEVKLVADPGVTVTPVPRAGYRIGVPQPGFDAELLNSDSRLFGGSDLGNGGGVESSPVAAHGFDHSVTLVIPPLGCLLLKRR